MTRSETPDTAPRVRSPLPGEHSDPSELPRRATPGPPRPSVHCGSPRGGVARRTVGRPTGQRHRAASVPREGPGREPGRWPCATRWSPDTRQHPAPPDRQAAHRGGCATCSARARRRCWSVAVAGHCDAATKTPVRTRTRLPSASRVRSIAGVIPAASRALRVDGSVGRIQGRGRRIPRAWVSRWRAGSPPRHICG